MWNICIYINQVYFLLGEEEQTMGVASVEGVESKGVSANQSPSPSQHDQESESEGSERSDLFEVDFWYISA
jgi:hypothetical protein